MSEERESFVFHKRYVEDLPEDKKSKFCHITVMYALFGEEPSFDDAMEKAWWTIVKKSVDEDYRKLDQLKDMRSAAGKKHTGNQYTRRNAESKEE